MADETGASAQESDLRIGLPPCIEIEALRPARLARAGSTMPRAFARLGVNILETVAKILVRFFHFLHRTDALFQAPADNIGIGLAIRAEIGLARRKQLSHHGARPFCIAHRTIVIVMAPDGPRARQADGTRHDRRQAHHIPRPAVRIAIFPVDVLRDTARPEAAFMGDHGLHHLDEHDGEQHCGLDAAEEASG